MALKSIKLSPNSLNLYLECPHCFWLDKNLGIKRPPPYPYALNSAVDTLLKFVGIRYFDQDLKATLFGAVECLKNPSPPAHSQDCQFAIWLKGARGFSA